MTTEITEILRTLYHEKRYVELEKLSHQTLKIYPENGEVWMFLGAALKMLKRPDSAVKAMQRAADLMPENGEALANLGATLLGSFQYTSAEAPLRKALDLLPPDNIVEVVNNLAGCSIFLGRFSEALDFAERAIILEPNHFSAWMNKGNSLMRIGENQKALLAYQKAMDLHPQHPERLTAQRNCITLLNGDVTATPEARLQAARQYGIMMHDVQRELQQIPYSSWRCEPFPQRLKVGLVSPDFFEHPVGYFLESFLPHINRNHIELIAYPSSPRVDALTQRLHRCFSAWKPISDLPDVQAAALIHADGVHILLDLSGFTHGCRLPVFGLKPAPIQASYLGYFGTTGLVEMDYVIADEVGVPPEHRDQFVEKMAYLPDTRLCFSRPQIDVSTELCVLPPRNIRFGSFQQLQKINDHVLAVWKTILDAVPSAQLRLQINEFNEPAQRSAFLQRLIDAGFETERVHLHGGTSRADYLAAHAEVDIILDTFPYPGGTTTCEALWMGVPTVTLAGNSMASRQGASLLHAAGLDDWIAQTETEYVQKAIDFATHPEKLYAIRKGLREKIEQSPLMDGKRFARHFEQLMVAMWNARKNVVRIADTTERTNMSTTPDASVDAICSHHNLHHAYPHQVVKELAEFFRVLKPEGFLVISCPDLQSLHTMVSDEFRCGFTEKVLVHTLQSAGFVTVASITRLAHGDLWAVASKSERSADAIRALAGEHFPN